MRAIIIDDKDARALLEQLKLESLQGSHGVRSAEDVPAHAREALVAEVHRVFHYVVCRWLQDQGANVVR
jgi:hypothetical protein